MKKVSLYIKGYGCIDYDQVDHIIIGLGAQFHTDIEADKMCLQLVFVDGETATFYMDEIETMLVY